MSSFRLHEPLVGLPFDDHRASVPQSTRTATQSNPLRQEPRPGAEYPEVMGAACAGCPQRSRWLSNAEACPRCSKRSRLSTKVVGFAYDTVSIGSPNLVKDRVVVKVHHIKVV